jgi:sec-independent protein translocase protein TatC
MEIKNKPEGLSVFGHLDELRRRILFSVSALAFGTCFGLTLAKPLIILLKRPGIACIQEYVLLKPTDVISVYFKVALYCGAIISSPFICYQAWQFLKPAIPADVKVSLAGWIVAAAGLFAAGTVFAYFLLIPQALVFLLGLSREVATPMINLNFYLSFVLAMLLAGGAIFEIPIVVGLLTKLQILNPQMLRRRRKEAIFILCVIAAVITPTTDAFNMLIFVAPMIILYEASIWVSVLLIRAPKKDKSIEDVYHES